MRYLSVLLCALVVTGVLCDSVLAQPESPGDPDREWRFIEKLDQDGMADLALRQREEFARRFADDARAPVALLEAAEGRGRLGQAVAARQLFERVLADFPSSLQAPAAALGRAEILFDAQDFEAAAKAYESLLTAHPASDEVDAARLGLAESLMAQRRDTEARRWLGRLVGGRATDEIGSRAIFDLALLDLRAGSDSLAMARFESIHVQHPGRPIGAFGLLRVADMLIEREAPAAARQRYEQVLELYEEPVLRARAHLGIATTYEPDDPAAAASHYRSVAEEGGSEENVQTALLGLARAELAAGRRGEARSAAEIFLGRYPTAPGSTRARFVLAEVDLAEEQEGAEDSLLRLGDSPDHAVAYDALALLARTRTEEGRGEDALDAWRRAERVANTEEVRGEALLAQAALAHDAGRYHLAADFALSAAASGSDVSMRASALLRALESLLAAGDDAGAREIASRLTTEHPLEPAATRAREHLRNLTRKGRRDPAAAAARLAELALGSVDDPAERAAAVAEIQRDVLGDLDAAAESFERMRDVAATPEQRSRAEIELGRTQQLLALELGVSGDAQAARAALRSARGYLTEAAARAGAESAAHRARVRLVALDLAEAARPRAPWLFDPDRMPLLGAVGEAENVDLAGAGLDTARQRLASAAEAAADRDDRAWIAWRRAELSTAPLEDRIAFVEAALEQRPPRGREVALRYTLGQLFLQKEESGAAARQLGRVIDAEPTGELAMAARYGLAEAQRTERRYLQAAELYAEFASAYPETQRGQRALLLAGDCALFAGRADLAVERYRQLLARYPDTVYVDDALYRLGTALQREGHIEAAREPLLRLTRADGGSDYLGRALARLARMASDAGQDSSAVALYERLVDVDPERAVEEEAFVRGATLQVELGRSSEALRWLDRRAAVAEDDARVLALRTRALAASGEQSDAAEVLDRLSRSFPEEGDAIASARLSLADAWAEGGRGDRALEAYELARTETADATLRSRASYGAGLVHARAGALAPARDLFERAVSDDANGRWSAEALFKLGQLYSREGDEPRSQRAFARFASSFPSHALVVEALEGEARAWRQLGRFDEALEVYHGILERYPDTSEGVDILGNIAYCHHEMGQFEIAVTTYRRVLPLLDEEGQGYAQFWIADSLAQLGRHEEAATEFLRIPYLYPGLGQLPVTAQLKAGESYEALGRADSAEQLYRRVVAAHGAGSQWGAEAQRRLDRLRDAQGEQ